MKFNNDIPIYLQLIGLFKDKILKGEWKADERIPSVRDLAVEYGVNPNTVQRALAELEQEGFLRSERTLGRFVQANDSSLEKLKREEINDISKSFIMKMKAVGMNKENTIKIISDNWEDV